MTPGTGTNLGHGQVTWENICVIVYIYIYICVCVFWILPTNIGHAHTHTYIYIYMYIYIYTYGRLLLHVSSRLVWWVGIESSVSKIILNQCNCWCGSVLWQVFQMPIVPSAFFTFGFVHFIKT